jgi:hypothetical protein
MCKTEEEKSLPKDSRSERTRWPIHFMPVEGRWFALYSVREADGSTTAYQKRLLFWGIVTSAIFMGMMTPDVVGMVFGGEGSKEIVAAPDQLPDGVTFIGYIAPGMTPEEAWKINSTEPCPNTCPIHPVAAAPQL